MKKPFFKISQDNLGRLREKECEDEDGRVYILGSFLTIDVGADAAGWKQWAIDDIASIGGGNFSSIYMINDNSIRIQEEWEELGKGPYIELSKEEFIHILDEWQKAYQKDTREILITREEDGSIHFEVKK
jgi:hypothetical protein